ncbi:hypothetical protein OsJ_08684 [Oryza sativa Japonica Group]|uniref:Uncharacterized protein n=1 Tax=Oryza sativa subsp. japonica TaxID=39947 RepID=B9F3P1_ORYSJ|nr:hypothetical protein OsJ_08684 [Oryza sativa Japonica Group]
MRPRDFATIKLCWRKDRRGHVSEGCDRSRPKEQTGNLMAFLPKQEKPGKFVDPHHLHLCSPIRGGEEGPPQSAAEVDTVPQSAKVELGGTVELLIQYGDKERMATKRAKPADDLELVVGYPIKLALKPALRGDEQ